MVHMQTYGCRMCNVEVHGKTSISVRWLYFAQAWTAHRAIADLPHRYSNSAASLSLSVSSERPKCWLDNWNASLAELNHLVKFIGKMFRRRRKQVRLER